MQLVRGDYKCQPLEWVKYENGESLKINIAL